MNPSVRPREGGTCSGGRYTRTSDRLQHQAPPPPPAEGEFFIDYLRVRIHLLIVMIKWTGLAPWEFEQPFPGSLTSTFLAPPTTEGWPRHPLFSRAKKCWSERGAQGYLAHKEPPPRRTLK